MRKKVVKRMGGKWFENVIEIIGNIFLLCKILKLSLEKKSSKNDL